MTLMQIYLNKEENKIVEKVQEKLKKGNKEYTKVDAIKEIINPLLL